MDVSEDGSITTSSVSLPTERNSKDGVVRKRKDREVSGGAVKYEDAFPESYSSSEGLPTHLNQWRASTLKTSHLSDFLEV